MNNPRANDTYIPEKRLDFHGLGKKAGDDNRRGGNLMEMSNFLDLGEAEPRRLSTHCGKLILVALRVFVALVRDGPKTTSSPHRQSALQRSLTCGDELYDGSRRKLWPDAVEIVDHPVQD